MKENFNSDSGFSLIEVLVTLALISILSGLMIASIAQIRTILTITRKNDAAVEVEALANYVANSIRSLRSLPLLANSEMPRAALRGSEHAIKFVGITRIGNRDFALREIEMSIRPSDNVPREFIHVSASRRFSQNEQPLQSSLAAVDNVSFKYLAIEGWQTEWANQSLPIAVKIDVSITRSGQTVDASRLVRFPER